MPDKRRRRKLQPIANEGPQSLNNRRIQTLVDSAKSISDQFNNRMFAQMYSYAVEQKCYHNNEQFLRFISHLEQLPVDIETFLDSGEFMGATSIRLWPKVRRAIIKINKYWWKGATNGAMVEALLMGATRTGKSEISKITTAYHLHILGCMKSPQRYFNTPDEKSIVMVIQSAKPHVTKKVLYVPFRKYIEAMPWFQQYLRPNRFVESQMYFEKKNIRVVPAGGDADEVLGEDLISAILDEVNFMNIVTKSKRAEIGTGRPGLYDQAQATYDIITRRKKGTFLTRGPHIGVICVGSSARYQGDFTDKRKAQIRDLGENNVFVYDYAQYDVRPKSNFCGDNFLIVTENDAAMDIRVEENIDAKINKNATTYTVPVEYLDEFRKDASGSLRDIIGKSVNSINPFFRSRHLLAEAVELGVTQGLESFLVKDNVILGLDGMPVVIHNHYCKNPSAPRYIHIDLSANNDRCGIAMLRYDGMVNMPRATGEMETLPKCSVEMALTIQPDPQEEIQPAEIRAWTRQLKSVYGYPIKAVTYDGWQCIADTSLITTNTGARAAKDIVIGDMVQSLSGYKAIKNIWYQGVADTLVIKVEKGNQLEMTHNHKIEILDTITTSTTGVPTWRWCKATHLVNHYHFARIWRPDGSSFPSKISSIAPSTATVIDFEVSDDPSYIANGFVSHNSLESRQQWKNTGMPTGLVSVDKTDVPYKNFRDAIYDGRVAMLDNPILLEELYSLEYYEKTKKIDHPVNGSKDCIDAVCGAFTTLIRDASTWLTFGTDSSDMDRPDTSDRVEVERI